MTGTRHDYTRIFVMRCIFMCVLFAVLAAMTLVMPARAENDGLKENITVINQEVEEKKEEVENLNRKIDQYRNLIMGKKLESASLEDQLALFDNSIAKTGLDIDIAKEEIRSIELIIESLDDEIAEKEAKMVQEKRLMSSLARRLYRAEFKKSTLELLLTHDSFSDFFDSLHAVGEMQQGVRDSFAHVKWLHENLTLERELREQKKIDIDDHKRALEVAQRELEDAKEVKQTLLIETKESELRYRYMLAELKREQSEADSEIIYLEKVLREKMDLIDRLKGTESILSWPVEPTRGLSAVFHDPEYPFRHIFEHPGVDIRAYQGTPVRAAASGIIGRAKDNGMGYSYVLILHGGDIATVYGHLSKITVREDTFIERGEVIGYSGGMPGTPGAGRLSTGPHLHFETRLGGIPQDPEKYLMVY